MCHGNVLSVILFINNFDIPVTSEADQYAVLIFEFFHLLFVLSLRIHH
jgi:hypothetical protein